jgi:hypothetical protein
MNLKRIFIFALLVGFSPYIVAVLQGLTISFFFDAYGYNKSPADAAMNVRYVRKIGLALTVLLLYFWFVFGLKRTPLAQVGSVFLAAICLKSAIDASFGSFKFADFFDVYALGHLLIATLSILVFLYVERFRRKELTR